ncbi:MAG TPA: tetratricopeptide repeat protein [Candidatus Bathyarchaeia archaeon]|jgi:tetratricopeptide (TPR) repeat protein|nr:tetratricopeptide repeat protein [Candidatus Bathyarchaeia archaeon]
MFRSVAKYLLPFIGAFSLTALLSGAVFAQRPTPGAGAGNRTSGISSPLEGGDPTIEIDIYVKGADGGPIEQTAMVTLVAPTGQIAGQGTTLGGNIKFSGIAASQYTIQVVAAGYENAVKDFDGYNAGASRIIIDMRPSSDRGPGAGSPQILLAPKAQKELAKALEVLRANKPADAQNHLEKAYRIAPDHPAVNYLYGVYFLQMKDQEKAKSYWTKTLEFNPKHVSALLSMSEALLREQKVPDAESYVRKAVEADPNSWRAHAILADVLLKESQPHEAVKEADHAEELGKGQAAMVQPMLARALAASGDKERAIRVLQEYVTGHPNDAAAGKQLEALQSPVLLASSRMEDSAAGTKPSSASEVAVALPLPSNWLPSDVDEKVPTVEPGAGCVVDNVLGKAAKRVEEFVKNVDRFTATESLKHESINKWGLAESPDIRKFDYVASIDQYRPGYFSVMEYRKGVRSLSEFPDGVQTTGLSALALIFHPNNAGNFAMSCEGLGQWNGRPAWQVHFRQRPDKPNTIRAYRFGENGPSYSVALRGRAWIAADSYQIVRMETDLVAPMPQIRLVTDHTLVDYGPVHFKRGNVEMWLPQSAELYSDWRGKRMHRRLTYSNYLLFSVDEKQKISEPKVGTESQQQN